MNVSFIIDLPSIDIRHSEAVKISVKIDLLSIDIRYSENRPLFTVSNLHKQ